MSKIGPVSSYAQEAYNKVLSASKNLKPSQAMDVAQQQMNILRIGDNIEINSRPSAQPSFPEVLTDIVVNKAQMIRKPDVVVKNSFRPNENGQVLGANNIQMLQALNEADATLMLVQAARNNIVNAFHDIIKMPL